MCRTRWYVQSTVICAEHGGWLCREERRCPEVDRTLKLRVAYGLAFGKTPQVSKGRIKIGRPALWANWISNERPQGETQYPQLDLFSTFLVYDSARHARDSPTFLQDTTEQWMNVARAKGAYGAGQHPLVLMTDSFWIFFTWKGYQSCGYYYSLGNVENLSLSFPFCPAGWPGASLPLSVCNQGPGETRQPALRPHAAPICERKLRNAEKVSSSLLLLLAPKQILLVQHPLPHTFLIIQL